MEEKMTCRCLKHTVGLLLLVALLGVTAIVALAILVVSLLAAVLREATCTTSAGTTVTLAVVLLVLLGVAAVLLARLESLGSWGERGGSRGEGGAAWTEGTGLRVLLVDVELLLGLARQVVVLGGWVVFPRVEVRHCDGLQRGGRWMRLSRGEVR